LHDNLLGETLNTAKKNKEIPLDAKKEIGLETNEDKTEYSHMTVSLP
jgi:hypothetical protein